MVRRFLAVAALATLSGCSLAITYTDKLGPGVFKVRVNGNAYSKAADLEEKLAQRANKLCKKGPYEVSQQHFENAYVYSGGPIRTAMLTMEAVVTCGTTVDAPSKAVDVGH